MATAARWLESDRTKLTALMDKLTAVTMDLKPLCDRKRQEQQAVPVESTIAAACEIMQAALDDLRDVIKSMDSLSAAARKTTTIDTANESGKKRASRRVAR